MGYLNDVAKQKELKVGEYAENTMGASVAAENGGLTLERMGELVMQADREDGTNFFDQNDANAGLNAVLEVLGQAETMADINQYIQRNREEVAWREATAVQRMEDEQEQMAKDAWYMEQYHATEEELAAYNEYLAEAVVEIYGEDVDYEQRIATFAEIQLNEYGNQGADAGLRPSANTGEGLASDREGGSSVGETERINQREVPADAAGVAASEDQGIGGSVSSQSDAERAARIAGYRSLSEVSQEDMPTLTDEEIDDIIGRELEDEERWEREGPVYTEERLDNGDVRITGTRSNGEIASVAIERGDKVISVDSYDDGVLFEHTDYDENGNATNVVRYDKNGQPISEQEYTDGKRKATANYFEMAEQEQRKRKQDERKKRVSEVSERYSRKKEGGVSQENRRDSSIVRGRIEEFEQRTGWTEGLNKKEREFIDSLRRATDAQIVELRDYILSEIPRGIKVKMDVKEYERMLQLLDLYGRSGERLYVLSQSGIIPNKPVELSKVVELFGAYNGDAGLAALLDRVLPIIEQIAPKVTFEVIRDAKGNVEDTTVGEYSLSGNHIRFNLHSLNSSAQTDQEKANTIVHEMLHAVAQYAVDAKERINKGEDAGVAVDTRLLDAAQSLINIYEKIKDNESLQDEYGVTDVHEMISELANPVFRDKLQKIHFGKRSMWQRIKDAFARFIGRYTDVYDSSAYGQAREALDVLMDNFDKNAYGQARGLSSGAKEARVYHGSGADFDRFDHSFMGTGEGAQAFGWGTYVTEVDGIARSYADAYGKKIFKSGFGDFYLRKIREHLSDGGSFDDVKQHLLDYHKNMYDKTGGDTSMYGDFISDYEKLRDLKEEDLPARRLYTVEIPDNNGKNYLEWYGIIGNGEKILTDMANRLGLPSWYFTKSFGIQEGGTLYNSLSRTLGSDKAASQFLHDMGYVGIKYPTNTLHGGNMYGTSNYVIFDENDLEIVDNVRFRKKESLETALPEDGTSFKGTAISSDDGAKVLKDLDNAIAEYENKGTQTKNFVGDVARALGIKADGKSSKYATFEAKNGEVFTIRISDHNATVSNFDNAEEGNGISIVVSRKPNQGIMNDGEAHLVEFFYSDKKLKAAEGNPLAEILKSIKQALYSGEYQDNTGLAEREEVNERLRKGEGAISDKTVSYENDPIGKWQGKPRYYGKRAAAFAERERARMERAVAEVAEKLGIEVEVVTAENAATVSQRTQRIMKRQPKAKGWYDIETKKVTVVVPNHVSAWDAVQTVLHEGVAHHGLRELFGDGFDAMLDNVYNNVAPELKAKIDAMAEEMGVDTRVATEEYLASLAEDTNFEEAQNKGWWAKIKEYFALLFRSLGLKHADVGELGDNELRFILWRSYMNLTEPNYYAKPLGYLDDVAKQKELKVGEYAESVQGASMAAEGGLRLRAIGGNSGYVGYSMSKRAAKAREEGRFPKTDFKKEYGVTDKVLDALVKLGVINNSEWHHTSKFGNKTTFYGWEEDSYAEYYEQHRDEIIGKVRNGETEGLAEEFEAYEEEHKRNRREMEAREKELTREYGEYRKENAPAVPAEYNASNGVRVITNGSSWSGDWKFYWGENEAFKKYARVAEAELAEKVRAEDTRLSFAEWRKAKEDRSYTLSNKKDNEGNVFFETNGSIDLWNISSLLKKARRQDAPIRLTDANMKHIIDSHKTEIGGSEKDVFRFLDNVFSNAYTLRKAKGRAMFVVVEKTNTDKAAIIKLYPSNYGDYYNVESAGYYRKDKWKNTEEVIAELSEPTQSDTASDVSKPQAPNNSGRMPLNAETATISADKVSNNSSTAQGENVKSRNEAEIISEVEREAAALGVPVTIARSVDELPDDANTRKRAEDGSLKGVYSTRDGEVVVYLPNTENANDAKRTILHEIVGHKGGESPMSINN